ncbi:unnamed protein product, partial [Darwinula stevensoni]
MLYDKVWVEKYPAPKDAKVTFICGNPQGFTDGSKEHSAACAVKDPDVWWTSSDFQHIRCESPVRDIYYKLNTYRASVARVEVTGCKDCDGKLLPTALNMNELFDRGRLVVMMDEDGPNDVFADCVPACRDCGLDDLSDNPSPTTSTFCEH